MTAPLTPVAAFDPTIPALPPALQRVPSWLDGPRTSDAWRGDWPGYSANLIDFRVWVTKKAATDSAFRQLQMQAAADDVAYFLAVFGWIFEPRDGTALGDPGWYPWTLFPHQVIALRQLQEAMRTGKPYGDIVWEKSRTMGATWLAMGYCLHQWLFAPAFTAGLVSYREDAVDDGTPDSMFFKLRGLYGVLDYGDAPGIPRWMRPAGFVKEIHGRRLKFNHPTKTCVVRGESTTARGGTGARNTLRVNDEGAKHDQFSNNLESQRAVTNHILSLSSAYRGFGRDFEQHATHARETEERLAAAGGIPDPATGGPRYYRMEYWMHPEYDETWRTAEEAAYSSKEAFAREVLIDYQADAGLTLYGEEAAKVPLTDAAYDPELPLYIGIDPGLKDPTALVFAHAWGDPYAPSTRWFDSYEAAGRPTQFFGHLLSGIAPQPGDVCHDMYEFGAIERELMDRMLAHWLARRRLTVVMDPAGAQATLAAISLTPARTQGHIFPEQLDRFAISLRERYVEAEVANGTTEAERQAIRDRLPAPGPFPVRWKHLYSMNRFDPRQSNLRTILAKAEVAKTRGGFRLLECLRESVYQKRLDSAQATTEPKAVHDEFSHIRTSAEFLASHLLSAQSGLGLAAANRRPQSARRPPAPRRKAA